MSLRTRLVRHLGYRCFGPTITPRKIERLKTWLVGDLALRRAGTLAKALAGRSRLAILALLGREAELCVCDLSDLLGTTVSAVSHQLRALRGLDLVRWRRDQRTIYYALSKKGTHALEQLSVL